MWNDVKCAWRSLRTHSALTATASLVLAAALGFNIAAFSIVNTLMLSPYPYPQLSRLVLIRDQRLADGAHQGNPIASGAFVDLRREQYEFTAPLFAFVQVAALFVLLLGAANVVNLLIARAMDRRREFGVRVALGASRARVFALMLTEAVTLSIVAGIAGALIASWSIPLIHAALPEGIARWIAGWQSIDLDRRVVAVSAALTLLTGIALGGAMGWHAVRAAATITLRDAGRSGAPRLTLLSRGLIVSEVVFALVLLLGAGVTLRGFQRLGDAFQSLAPESALRFRVALPPSRYPDSLCVLTFQDRLLERIGELPGVTAAGLIRNEPASNVSNPQTPFTIDGRAAVTPSGTPRVDLQTISAGGFDAVKLRRVRGRTFASMDGPTAPPVAVISEEMARRFWPGADPIGARIRVDAPPAPWTTVVGVVSDLKLNWYDPEPRPTLYLPHTQLPSPQMYVIVRTTASPDTLAGPIRAIGVQLDPLQPLGEMQRMDEAIRESVSPVRVLGLLLLIGGTLAIIFAATGIYGVLAHWVTLRWREFGIRIALGATSADISRAVVRQAIGLAAIGVAIGVPCGLAGLSWLQSRLFGVTIADVRTTLAVSAFVLVVVTLAALVPARRALCADPAILLQSE